MERDRFPDIPRCPARVRNEAGFFGLRGGGSVPEPKSGASIPVTKQRRAGLIGDANIAGPEPHGIYTR